MDKNYPSIWETEAGKFKVHDYSGLYMLQISLKQDFRDIHINVYIGSMQLVFHFTGAHS